MIIALHIGRLLMVGWILYSLFLLFAPHLLHQPPNDVFASSSALAAFVLGNLMDRLLGVARRKKAERSLASATSTDLP